MADIQKLYNLPDVNFVDLDVEKMLADAITEYEEAYYQSTGERKTLAQGDPIRIWIYTSVLREYQSRVLINNTGKQNLLKYSAGTYLEHLGARVGVTRLPAAAAVATQRFTLSAPQPMVIPIPQGTRVSPGNNIFFETVEYAEVSIGATYIDIIVQCMDIGVIGNDFYPGLINILVDPIQYVASTANQDRSQGGAPEESDSALRERIFLKPDSFSVAGPESAYEYFTKSYSSAIKEVSITSPSDGEVVVRFLLINGEIPEIAIRNEVLAYLSDKTRRPLTDHVSVPAPNQQNYDIFATYYISNNDQDIAVTIQAAVEAALDAYQLWQKTKFGRDINPSVLNSMLINAGAKRVVINNPVFTELDETTVANDVNVTLVYGGLEDE